MKKIVTMTNYSVEPSFASCVSYRTDLNVYHDIDTPNGRNYWDGKAD